MNWQHQTLLHHLSRRAAMKQWIVSSAADAIEKATILLDAGANMSLRDEEYRSTPLGWASRTNAVEMVEFSSHAVLRQIFQARKGGPHRLPGQSGVVTRRLWQCSDGTELLPSYPTAQLPNCLSTDFPDRLATDPLTTVSCTCSSERDGASDAVDCERRDTR